MAATIGARLANFIHQSLKKRFHNLRVVLWSDSQIVLHWLQDRKPLKKFIQNRVTEINQLYPTSSWHYCPTSDNPGDLRTRGITAAQLQSSLIWQHGPTWLVEDNLWPNGHPQKPTFPQHKQLPPLFPHPLTMSPSNLKRTIHREYIT